MKSLHFMNEILHKNMSQESIDDLVKFCYDWNDLAQEIEKPDIGIPLVSRALCIPVFSITELESSSHKHKRNEERYV